ncbi:helix-turn-helix domain-containing protein [Streptosporangium carneum]|uniref:HTH cro/C1-type domain-containing protein n=1 Tax=Streptosporangium carneum TaxID=47481 RepID=A0A9W6HX98_9ACTN|nr:helix-turn-helix domain-containing protein [Streptosporangium carneum]GLK08085.1 hypothetical protein GCM10017600_14900 [Streptosporangium carneum]
MNNVLRLTGATLDVLEVLAAADGQTVYGLQIAAATRRPTGTVYPLLARLEDRGWLEGGWESDDGARGRGPRRRYYRVTGEGREHVAAALRRRERKVPPPPPATAARPDRFLPPPGGAVDAEQVIGEFVHELRVLRERAGALSLRQLAARTYYSPAALSEAFAGRTLPSERLLEAIVSACAGDSREWTLRRSTAEQSIRHGIRIPHRFEDFHPLGVQWVETALSRCGLQRADIEDVAQETLLAAYRHWPSAIPNLRQWISQHAQRTAAALSRGPLRPWHLDGTYLPALDLDLGVAPPERGELRHGDVADDVVARLAADDLLRSMDRRTAQVVHLVSHGFTTAEIAERLAMTAVAVEGRRRRLRTRFRLDGASSVTAEHARYLRHLARLRDEAGNPSLRRMAGQVGYSHTHIAAVLAGAAPLPDWEFTARLVGFLGGEVRTARALWEEAHAFGEPVEPDNDAEAAARVGDTLTLWKLTDHLEQAGKTIEAVQVWWDAAEAGDTYAMAMTAELLVRLGDREEAETWLRRAADAGDAEAWRRLIHLLEQTGRTEEAIDAWRHAANTGAVEARQELTRLLEQTGRTEEAIDAWRHAANTGDLSATRKLTRLLEQTGRTEEAVDAWRHAANTGAVEARQELTRLLEQTGRTEEAIDAWQRVAESGDLSATRRLTRLLRGAGRTEEAVEAWRRAVDTGEAGGAGDVQARQELTRLLEQTGRTEEAVEVWRHVAITGDVQARQELTRLLEQTGRTEEAVEVWRHVAITADDPAQRTLAHQALTRLTDRPLSSLRVEYELRAAAHTGDDLALLALVHLLDQEGRHREAEAVLHSAAIAGNALAAQTISHRLTTANGTPSHSAAPPSQAVSQAPVRRAASQGRPARSRAEHPTADPANTSKGTAH